MSTRFMRAAIGLAVTTILATACGGGGGGGNGPSGNTAPTISGLSDQNVGQDTMSSPVNFTIADRESDPSMVSVTVDSSNKDLLSMDGITVTGNAGARAITLTPNERLSGSAMITVTATDQQGAASRATFMVNVTTQQVSFKGFAGQAFVTDQNGMPASIAGLSFTPDADDDPSSFDNLVN